MKNEFILDPLWITKGRYLDAEYFNYILLDASSKYKKEIEEANIDHFYEVLFHVLNLNNLAVKGNIFTAKFKEIWKDPRIQEIQQDLVKLYELPQDTAEIFKNANYVFLNVLVEYMQIHLDILEQVQIFYVNPLLHMEKEIFVVTNQIGSLEYRVWKLTEDSKKNFGYSFSKVKNVKIDAVRQDAFTDAVEQLALPKLMGLDSSKNVCYAICDINLEDQLIAKTVKDAILLNKGIAKKIEFEPLLVAELYQHIWFEKMLPFTLDQWKFEQC